MSDNIQPERFNETHRAYIRSDQAWYAAANKIDEPEIMVTMAGDDYGTAGEFGIRWRPIGDEMCPRIEMYRDSWALFVVCSDLFAALAELDVPDVRGVWRHEKPVTPADVEAILKRLGFVDATDRTSPYGQPSRDEALVRAREALSQADLDALGLTAGSEVA